MSTKTAETDGRTVEQLTQTVEQLKDTVEDLKEENQELKEELANHKDHTGREFADVRARITDVENQQTEATSEGETPGVEADNEGPQCNETPLELITALPEHIADRELSANQLRARFIARDISDYGERVMAGIRINTTTMKRVLSAAADDGEKIYRTSIKRTMEFLDQFGEDEVTVKKARDGRKIAVFSEELVERINEQSGMDGGESNSVCYGVNGGRPLRAD